MSKTQYNMKKHINWALLAVGFVSLFSSCADEPDKFELTGGKPTINYIRLQDVASKDSLLVEAFTSTPICIVGENLTSIKEMFFNDVKATLNTSYITKNTMLLNIPKEIPGSNTGKIYMVTRDADTVTYDFKVLVPAPVVTAMKNEWTKVGDDAVITGQYFVDDPNQPLTVTFTGIGNSTDITVPAENFKSITPSQIVFKVPEGVEEGQIEVESIYGVGKSKFYFHDSRNLITNFDGATDVVPQGWNIAATYSDVNGIDGQYVQLGPAETEGGWVEELKLPFWCGNWNGDPMSITSGPGIPLRNFIDFTDWEKMSFKMELYIPKSNPWSAGAMQILFVNNKQCANDSWQNNTYIHTSADGGLDLPRALYNPWKDSGSFDTGDEWITVTIPLTDFVYNDDGSKVSTPMSVSSFDSFIIWPINGGVSGTVCTPIFRYDNIRVVPNL